MMGNCWGMEERTKGWNKRKGKKGGTKKEKGHIYKDKDGEEEKTRSEKRKWEAKKRGG